MTRGILAILAVIALLLTGCSRGNDAPAESPAVAAKSVPTVLILDASGSMTENDAPGPRIEAAKTAAHGLLQALPDDSTLGLLAYGTATGSADTDKPAGCNDVRMSVIACR